MRTIQSAQTSSPLYFSGVLPHTLLPALLQTSDEDEMFVG